MNDESLADVKRKLVKKSALRVVALDDLKTDPSYQREVKGKHKKIVADFDETALGIPIVGERGDGSLWIVDGLQRATAVRKLGWRTIRAEVFASQGPEHEASIFKLVNMNRVKLTPMEEFKALLTAHDADVWAVKEAVEAAGFRVGHRHGPGKNSLNGKTIDCVNTLRRAARDCKGVRVITDSLEVIKACWPDDPMAVNSRIIAGLAIWWARCEGVIDMERLVPRFRRTTPHKILYAAGQMATGGAGGGSMNAVADFLERLYARRARREKPGDA